MEFHIATEKELKYCCRRLRELGRWEWLFPNWKCPENEFAAWMLHNNVPIAMNHDGGVTACCWLYDFEGKTARIGFAALEPLTREMIRGFRAVVRGCFGRSGLVAILGLVDGSNRASLHVARRVGFREAVKIPAGAADGSDLYVMIANKEDVQNG